LHSPPNTASPPLDALLLGLPPGPAAAALDALTALPAARLRREPRDVAARAERVAEELREVSRGGYGALVRAGGGVKAARGGVAALQRGMARLAGWVGRLFFFCFFVI
jgi:hypothetical protein